MTDETPTPATAVQTPAAAAGNLASAQVADGALGSASGEQEQVPGAAARIAAERPEIVVAGAFAAGFVIAMILKRIGH